MWLPYLITIATSSLWLTTVAAGPVNIWIPLLGTIDVSTQPVSHCKFEVLSSNPEIQSIGVVNTTSATFTAWGLNRTSVADQRIRNCSIAGIDLRLVTPYSAQSNLQDNYFSSVSDGVSAHSRCTTTAGWGYYDIKSDNRTTYQEWSSSGCFNQQWQLVLPYWSFSSSVCTNRLNLTCGGMAGTRTITSYLYVRNICPGYTIDKCQVDIRAADCWTPPCPIPVADCSVATEYGPWSACEAYQDSCQKRRVKEILTNATGGGVECPSLESRTQITECTAIECQRIRCNYTTVTVVGNCSAPCGPALVNTTVFNVSLTPLSICSQGMEPVASVAYNNCTTNLPCKSNDPVTPINISCYTSGVQGAASQAISKVVIDLGLHDLSFNGTNTSLASSFRVTHSLSGRPFFIDPNRMNVSGNGGTVIELGLLIAEHDMEPSTGYILDILYTPVADGTNGTLYAGGIKLTSFRCTTEDRVPPAIMYASATYQDEGVNSAETNGMITFTEDVWPCVDPTESFYGSDFSWSTLTGSAGDLIPINEWEYPFTFAFAGTPRVYPNTTVTFLSAGIACDRAGNPNLGSLTPVAVEVHENITTLLPETGGDTIKLYQNNETKLINTVAVFSRVPLDVDFLQTNLGQIQVTAIYRNETSGGIVTVTGNGTSIKFENYDNTAGTATQFVLEFDTSSITWNVSASNNLTLYNFTVTYPPTVQDAIVLPPVLVIVTPNISISYPSTNVPSPRVLSAQAFVGGTTLIITFDRPKSGGRAFQQQDFIYSGLNRVLYLGSQLDRVVELEMGASFTYSMFGSDRITFTDSTPTNQATASTVQVSNALGPRPLITSAALERSANAEMWDTLRVVMNEDIGSFSIAPLSGGIFFTWTSPLIQSIEVTDYTVSGATIYYKLTPACADSVCFDIDTPIFVTIRGINNALGVLMEDFESVRVVDLNPPKPVSAIKLEGSVYFLTFNKQISASSNQLVDSIIPKPESCQYLPDTTTTCYYAEDLCGGDLSSVSFESATVRDTEQNSNDMVSTVSIQCTQSQSSCNFWQLPAYIGYPVLVLSAVGVISSLAIGGHWIYQRYWLSRKGSPQMELVD